MAASLNYFGPKNRKISTHLFIYNYLIINSLYNCLIIKPIIFMLESQ